MENLLELHNKTPVWNDGLLLLIWRGGWQLLYLFLSNFDICSNAYLYQIIKGCYKGALFFQQKDHLFFSLPF